MSREKQIEEMVKDLDLLDSLQHNFKYTVNYQRAQGLYGLGYRKQSDLTPCDVCRFNPPSSTDGKPCLVCPAQAKTKGGAE